MPATIEVTRAQISRILQSDALRASQGLRRLFEYLAKRSLAGDGAQLKEYSIGIDAFGKPPEYDPRRDSTVRIQAGRLRQKLADYYAGDGRSDPLLIELPKGRFELKWRRLKTQAAEVPIEHRVFLTLQEGAQFSGLPASDLRRLIRSEELRAVRIGDGWRIPRAALESLADALTPAKPAHLARELPSTRNRYGFPPE
jgi:excisionase family DNA binding protein